MAQRNPADDARRTYFGSRLRDRLAYTFFVVAMVMAIFLLLWPR